MIVNDTDQYTASHIFGKITADIYITSEKDSISVIIEK